MPTGGRTRSELASALAAGARVGTVAGLTSVLLWAFLVFSRTPEPARFLMMVRQQTQEVWDLKSCWDCPAFLLLDRSFVSPHDPLGTVLGVISLPSVLVSRRTVARLAIPELSPPRFVAALMTQWIVIAVAARALLWLVGHRWGRNAVA